MHSHVFPCQTLRVTIEIFQALRFVDMLQDVGLDPSDTTENRHTAVGIGNLCGRMINEVRDNDGQNSKGDIGASSPYNHKPFNDYTNYKVIQQQEFYGFELGVRNKTFGSEQAKTRVRRLSANF